jgi:hypothetical protein
MQTQGFETVGLPVGNGQWICRQANDISTLEQEMAQAFAAYITPPLPTPPRPAALLYDIDLSGGGAGNVFICQALLLPGDAESDDGVRLENQTVKWFTASDARTLQTKENAFLATLGPTVSLWAWSATCAGDGAVWGKVMVFWTPDAPG